MRITRATLQPAYLCSFRVLDRNDVDVVVNATPDHWHTLVNMAAAAARKDIYAGNTFAA